MYDMKIKQERQFQMKNEQNTTNKQVNKLGIPFSMELK
jgi:hypothetical protein